MFTRILVPVDGSARAEQALLVAARIARASGGTLLLVQVVDVAAFSPPYVHPPAMLPNATTEAMEAAQAYLSDLASGEALGGVESSSVVLTGLVAPALLEAIAAQQADLVVMTSHGRTGLVRWVLGSVSNHIVRHASVPVLLLRANGTASASSLLTARHLPRVLVPLDGSHYAEAALAPAAALTTALASAEPGAIHLALVLQKYPDELRQGDLRETLLLGGAKDYLTRVSTGLQSEYSSLTVSWSVAADLDVAAALLRVAEVGTDDQRSQVARSGLFPGGCDLVAMATHGTGGIARWVMGSITERVLNEAALPVLVVRPREVAIPE